MTFRSVLIGVALAAVLCFGAFACRMGGLIGPGFMPVGVFALLVVAAVVYNPIAGRFRKDWALSGPELAVVALLMMAGGSMPGAVGRMPMMAMMPHQITPIALDWQKAGVLEQIAPPLLAETTPRAGEDPLEGFLYGKRDANVPIGLSAVPWYAWRRPLRFYLPLFAAVSLALVGAALALHQQWSGNEKVGYPIATFAASLIPRAGGLRETVFCRWPFWAATAAVLAIHMVNYSQKQWFPEMMQIPLHVDLRPLFEKSETYMKGSPGDALMTPKVFFMVVGFSYLLASDLSLSMGLGPHIFTALFGWLLIRGVQIQGGVMTPERSHHLFAGSWAGMALALLYIGRRYYRDTLRQAICFWKPPRVAAYSAWGARLFGLAAAATILLLTKLDLHWLTAAGYFTVALMIFVVTSRLVSETGVYLINPYFFPAVTLVGLVGLGAIGAKSYMTMLVLTSVVMGSPILAFLAQGLKVAELKNVASGRASAGATVAVLACLTLAVPLMLYVHYDRGVIEADSDYATHTATRYPIDAALHVQRDYQKGSIQPVPEPSSALDILAKIRPQGDLVICFAVAASLVLLFTAARLRFPWWPLHPAMFLVLVTYQAQLLAGSFLLGWLIKTIVTVLGGSNAYERAKPIMIGLVAGEVLARTIETILDGARYLSAGA